MIVIDEADRLMEEGFETMLNELLNNAKLPPRNERQVLMFSATFPMEVRETAEKHMERPITISIGQLGMPAQDINQEVSVCLSNRPKRPFQIIRVKSEDKHDSLLELLKPEIEQWQAGKGQRTAKKILVFVERRRTSQAVATALIMEDLPAQALNGDLSQAERDDAMRKLRSGEIAVLVATGVAARGLDIVGMEHVINYDLPTSIDEYVHRIGRTGRVGNPGRATSFFDTTSSSDLMLARNLVACFRAVQTAPPQWLEDGVETGRFDDDEEEGGPTIEGGMPKVKTDGEDEW